MKTTVIGFVRQFVVGLAAVVALTVVVGGAYPVAVWAFSRIDATSAEGSPVTDRTGCTVGSRLVGVDQRAPAGHPDPYLHARVAGGVGDPMAPGDPSRSGASNLGRSSDDLRRIVQERRAVVAARENVPPSRVPADAVTGSGSGIDPDISPTYAGLQVPRIARVTGLSQARVRAIIAENTTGRQLGFLGEPTVNVIGVNVALGLVGPGCR
ncbi:potassium-transporting ATPase subunit C [Gordonia humi]|uniref:Potassium-transporting ATPase KdpC subunit n=1 Tax=Gordonia humi TaxID=686429 RepID=A0A840EXM3_9ACTN|nr:K+-transporting ATPase ATPase C chain [Gordonia humi]